MAQAQNPQAEQKVALSVSTINSVADYLSTKPFREVAGLIQALSQGEIVGGEAASGNALSAELAPVSNAGPAVSA